MIRLIGRSASIHRRLKLRLFQVKFLEKILSKNGRSSSPNFNPTACVAIEEYGKKHGYKFQHALNGGEYYIKELNYWVDGYDKKKNVVIEYDEPHHFLPDGKLLHEDKIRQKRIEKLLKCKFIRIKEE
jgi:hypothetical protein